MTSPIFRCIFFAVVISGLAACQSHEEALVNYSVDITRTTFGVAHITASDYGSLGYGEAYASAQDQVCNMAVALLTARGEAAKYFGAGHNNSHIYSDMIMQALDIPDKGRAALADQPEKIKQWIQGYTAGYNRYLADKSGDFGSWCDQSSWVKPVNAADFMTQYVALVYSLTRMAGAIVAAQPPEAVVPVKVPVAHQLAAIEGIKLAGMGSNGWALGSKATENGKGSLLANPHYPWFGTSRFWEKHLTIPGELNVYGTGLIGTPGVALGFNHAVAWTHTVSDSKRVVLYQLTLNPKDPTQYLYDGDWRSLEAKNVTVSVFTDDGLQTQTTPIWHSHLGPVVKMPGLDWTKKTAYVARDANSGNTAVLAQWLAMGQAQSMDEFIAAHKNYNAMPWVNTISTSADGRAVYLDNTNVAALSTDAIAAWQERVKQVPQLHQLYLTKGLVILDGSNSRDEWVINLDTPIPGTTPFEQRPLIESEFYVFNANDSYWLSDPKHPNTDYSPLYGATNSPRSVRTRMNIHLLEGLQGFNFKGQDSLFSAKEIQAALFDNTGLSAHLLKPELLDRCRQTPMVSLSNKVVDVTEACNILDGWDNRYNLGSRGAVLFREWITRFDYAATQFSGPLFRGAFDVAQPTLTPAGLTLDDRPLVALAEAVSLLTTSGIALDVSLGELQKAHRGGIPFSVHGGNRYEGIANLQETSPYIDSPIFSGINDTVGDSKTLSSSGYNIAYGSSFIMTLNYTEEGPKAQAILSYSQSGAPNTHHFSDQTTRYRDKAWRDIYFTPSAIMKNTISQVTLSE
jgi:acyl-homoserine-lactone acylase